MKGEQTMNQRYEVDIEMVAVLFGTPAVVRALAEGYIYGENGVDIIKRDDIDNLAWEDLIVADAIGRELEMGETI